MEAIRKNNAATNWKKVKKMIFSNEKLTFLENLPQIELNLFTKELQENQKEIAINYLDIKEEIKNLNSIKEFRKIKISKPIFNNLKASIMLEYNLEKIDNTGNVHLWPSEEILSIYSLSNIKMFENKKICELGCGFSGLCGILIAKNIQVEKMILSDGNKKCVESLKNNIKNNFSIEEEKYINEEYILWDRNDQFLNYNNYFDYILISDCLFFKNYHIDLINTIYNLMKNDGTCIIISPPRGKTMEMFIELAKEKFFVNVSSKHLKFINVKNNLESYNSFYIELKKIII